MYRITRIFGGYLTAIFSLLAENWLDKQEQAKNKTLSLSLSREIRSRWSLSQDKLWWRLRKQFAWKSRGLESRSKFWDRIRNDGLSPMSSKSGLPYYPPCCRIIRWNNTAKTSVGRSRIHVDFFESTKKLGRVFLKCFSIQDGEEKKKRETSCCEMMFSFLFFFFFSFHTWDGVLFSQALGN